MMCGQLCGAEAESSAFQTEQINVTYQQSCQRSVVCVSCRSQTRRVRVCAVPIWDSTRRQKRVSRVRRSRKEGKKVGWVEKG